MIRFCDKEVWTVQDGQWTRIQLVNFFIKGHINDIVQIVDERNNHIGVVTYRKLIQNHDCIPLCVKTFSIREDFWKEARNYFSTNPDDFIPVTDQRHNIIGFCYNDTRRYYEFQVALRALEEAVEPPVPLQKLYPRVQQVCIMDVNEFSYRLYQILNKLGMPVCVIGEKWKWFGIPSYLGFEDYPDFAKLFIFAEGASLVRVEIEYAFPGFEELGGGLWAIVDWAMANSRFVIEEQARRLTDLGANICKVIIPEYSDLSYVTELEAKSNESECMLEKYIDGQVEEGIREIYWKIWGKENCEYFKNIHKTNEDPRTLLNGLKCYTFHNRPDKPKIYLIGMCIVSGYALDRFHTLPAILQNLVGESYNIVAVISDKRSFQVWRDCFERIRIHRNDLIVIINSRLGFAEYPEGTVIDLLPEFNEPDRDHYFVRMPIHVNARGAEAIARSIYEKYVKHRMMGDMEKTASFSALKQNECIQKGDALTKQAKDSLYQYLSGISRFLSNSYYCKGKGGGQL